MIKFILAAIVALAPLVGQAQASQTDIHALLVAADTLRSPVPEGEMRAEITLVSPQGHSPALPFQVAFSAHRERRVELLAGERKGQRVLLTPEGYWLHMPGIAAPVPLTKLQRMLGQASFGDLGNLSFAQDYSVESWQADAGLTAVTLRATDPANAFGHAVLWVDGQGVPKKAEFLYPSGKVFKLIEFAEPETRDGIRMIWTLRFLDPATPGRYAEMAYSDLKPHGFAPDYFTAMALTIRKGE